MPLVTDEQIRAAYLKTGANYVMTEHHMRQAKLFIDFIFDILPVRGHIDETNAVAFDAYELSGCRVEPTYTRPKFE